MNTTNEEIKKEFERQVMLCSGIGRHAMIEIINSRFQDEHSGLNINEIANELSYYKTVCETYSKIIKPENVEALAKKCFYAGFEKAKKDDANCYTAWREEASKLLVW